MPTRRLAGIVVAATIAFAASKPALADALACFQQPEPVCLEKAYRAALEGAKPLDRVFRLGALAKLKAVRNFDAAAAAADFAAAREVADGIEDRHDRSVAFDMLGGFLAEAGELGKAAEAFAIARDLEDSSLAILSGSETAMQKIGALGDLADSRRRRGDVEGTAAAMAKAADIAKAIPDAQERNTAYLIVAGRHINAGENQAALAVLGNAKSAALDIGSVADRGLALLSVASSQMQAGDTSAARATLALAVDLYRRLDDGESKRTMGGSIALQFMLLM